MNHKAVTLETLADKLNLSKYSVSRALTGKPGVSEETRKAVLSLATELDYQHPTLTPKKPSRNALGTNILLLLPKNRAFDSEFWLGVLGGAEEEAQHLGFSLITRPFETGSILTGDMIDPSVQGLIGIGQPSREFVTTLPTMTLPVTLITHPRPFEPFDTVTTRNWEGGFAVGKHLFELGHRHILFITDATHELTRHERLRGLCDAGLDYQGVQVEELHVDLNDAALQLETHITRSFKKKPHASALFCARDDLAFTVIWTLNRLHLNVPQDVSVVGFTDGMMASQFVPKLTTVRSPVKDLGAAAMQNLLRRIDAGEATSAARHVSISPKLIVRDSTGRAPT